jgi:hypothetical protein
MSDGRTLRSGKVRAFAAVLAICVFAAGFLIGQRGRAATIAPGSDADPLVTRSYVDQFSSLLVLQLGPGQKLEGNGGTEIIVRSGTARAVASSQGGVCDLTGGKDLAQGERVPLNHLLILPRTDGRGIVADTALFIMVRGPYVIK